MRQTYGRVDSSTQLMYDSGMSILDDEVQRRAIRHDATAQRWSDVWDSFKQIPHLLSDLSASLFKVFGFWSKFVSSIILVVGTGFLINYISDLQEAEEWQYGLISFYAKKFPDQITPLVDKAMDNKILSVSEYGEIFDVYRDLDQEKEEAAARRQLKQARHELNQLFGK